MADSNIQNNSQPLLPGLGIPPTQSQSVEILKKELEDLEKSYLAQSMASITALTPALNMPVLPPYNSNGDNSLTTVVAAMGTNGGKELMGLFLMSQQLTDNSINKDILDGWSENIREIAEQVRMILASPVYRQQEELRLKGDPLLGAVSGVQSAASANSTSSYPVPTNTANTAALLLYVDNLQTFERVPPTGNVVDTTSPSDPTKILTIPLMGAFIAGGAIALASMEASVAVSGISSNPFQGAAEFINRLQPIFPQFIQNVIPTINLLVMPLVYFTSWDASIGNLRNKEGKSQQNMAQNFAKQVIKMVSDPTFILLTIVNNADKMQKYTPEQQKYLAAIVKLSLATVALSLLYALEVGKAVGNKFWGMEPEEFRGMLLGKIPMPDPTKGKLTEAEILKITLLKMIKEQLEILPSKEKAATLEATFEYLTSTHDIDDMTDPTKVFDEVFNSNAFNSNATGLASNPI
ncbi:MAG: hypothetical protein H0W88_02690 [Parachlamydiaceae bacterium]|nr:hypothetical protein [Parachlamydiaceae bacterium]